jgi:hypothetical protein
MANYKVSGNVGDVAKVFIFKDDVYLGCVDVSAGSYEAIFEASSATGVTAIAEKTNGDLVGYGGITAIATGSAVNITEGISINKIIHGAGTIANDTVSIDVDIGDTVDPDKSMVIYKGSKYNSPVSTTYFYRGLVALQLLNSTTLRGERGADFGGSTTTTFKFDIIEFSSGIKSVQRDIYSTSVTPPPAYKDITISSVDTSKTIISATLTSADAYHRGAVELELVDSTTMRIHTHLTLWSPFKVGYEIVEFV